MSYILDALRKADAERARGAVPDLHAQPVLRSSAGAAPSVGAAPWAWVAGAVALTAACGLVWLLVARDAPREPAGAAAVANVAAPAPLLPAPTVPIAAAPAPPVTVAVAPARVPAQPSALARPAAEPVRPLPRRPVADPAGIAPGPGIASGIPPGVSPDRSAASSARPSVSATAPAPAPAEPRVYAQAELPDEIRRALPALAIGGAMYSQNAASRMLIINGQVFHERDKLAPDLTLLQIKLKAAVLDYRGYRYSISY